MSRISLNQILNFNYYPLIKNSQCSFPFSLNQHLQKSNQTINVLKLLLICILKVFVVRIIVVKSSLFCLSCSCSNEFTYVRLHHKSRRHEIGVGLTSDWTLQLIFMSCKETRLTLVIPASSYKNRGSFCEFALVVSQIKLDLFRVNLWFHVELASAWKFFSLCWSLFRTLGLTIHTIFWIWTFLLLKLHLKLLRRLLAF